MSNFNIILPSKPRIVLEEGNKGIYEIDGLYRGYGHTLGNSLRRIILSSLPGAAITNVKIEGVSHEFSVVDGIKEDVISILLNLKKVCFEMTTDEPQTLKIDATGPKIITAKDIISSGQVRIINEDAYITELSDKKASLKMEITIEKGLGFSPKDVHSNGKVNIGSIALDAIFSPIRRVNYEVENMRVGDKTDYNRLRLSIETNGSITPREAIEKSIEIMITQLQAIIDFKPQIKTEDAVEKEEKNGDDEGQDESLSENDITDVMKTRIDSLNFSTRTENALTAGNIRTLGGLARKKKEDLLSIDGLGDKGIQEIEKILKKFNLELKD